MEYSNSILPKDGSYYTLQDASISGGILNIAPGGSARYEIVETDIVSLTEHFRVALMLNKVADRYNPGIRVNLHLRTTDDMYYNVALFPTATNQNVFMQEVQLQAGTYKSFIFEIVAEQAVEISLWELCPESSDVDITTIIEGVEQSLPRLLFDYNAWPLSVAQDETTIAMISYRLLDHTDLQGHFQLSYIASEAATLTLRFKDNGTTELFCPITYDIKPGKGSIGVPHAYLERLAGIHAVTVSAQVTAGMLAIDTRGILFTIDGGYLAERIIDIGVDMRDISIRQLSMDNGPDEIWIVGIEAGEALVRKRKYSPNAAIAMEPQFSLGKAVDAAIEFDGDWVLRTQQENYTLETAEQPWCFWIDVENVLHAQIGDKSETHVVLDEGVSSLSVCRGYKSTLYPEQDQGLVCAYIKNDQAYYRQYKYSTATSSINWDTVNAVDETLIDVSHISVSRLNDYRIQISTKHKAGVSTYISDRTYVTQSVKPEFLTLSSNIYRSLFNMDSTLTSATGTVSDLETSAGTKVLEIIYPASIRDYLATTSYTGFQRLADQTVVTCDKVSDVNVLRAEGANNVLKLHLDKIVRGVVTVQIPADNYVYITHSETVQGLFIAAQTLTINVMGVYNLEVQDSLRLNATTSGQIVSRPLTETTEEVMDALTLSSMVTYNRMVVAEVVNKSIVVNDDALSLDGRVEGTMTVTSVGTSPI